MKGGELMAKVVGPLFSVDASGKLADSIVFMKWRGINTVRQYARPSNPNTADQQAVRTAFQDTVEDYQGLAGADKAAWILRAQGLPKSGFNLLMGLSIKAKTEIDDFNLLKDVAADPSGGTGNTEAEISVTPKYAGTARVLYGTKAGSYFNEEEITLTAETPSTVVLTGLNEDTKYFYRIVEAEETSGEDTIRGETGDYSFTTLSA
jgi:hypothetical protein